MLEVALLEVSLPDLVSLVVYSDLTVVGRLLHELVPEFYEFVQHFCVVGLFQLAFGEG